MKDNRITLRRANPYHTRRNRIKPIRTPGNRLVAHYLKKRSNGMKCEKTGKIIHGIPHIQTKKLRKLKKNQRTVARAYGGKLTGEVVKEKIVQAFIEEESKEAADKQAIKEKKSKTGGKRK
uniref:Large ribosomal subunit protein eL34 n=1 Tax=Coptotermes formosanus TaxID=36987 RepID=R4UJJ7_COPFO|nr:ribosomal protein L34e [Coptotermes formosanus]